MDDARRRHLEMASGISGGIAWRRLPAPPPWDDVAHQLIPDPYDASPPNGQWLALDFERSDWIEPRLAWLSRPLPHRPLATLASSHIGRQYSQHGVWLSSIRQAVALDQSRHTWLIVQGTTCADLLTECCRRLGAEHVLVETPRATSVDRAWNSWYDRIRQLRAVPADDARLIMSPPLTNHGGTEQVTADQPTTAHGRPGVPLADRLLFSLPSTVLVLYRRPGSRTDEAIRRSPALSAPRTTIHLLPEPATADLFGWDRSERCCDVVSTFIDRPPWPALLHSTRRRDGAWPEQARSDFLSELLILSDAADRSPLATLVRILEMRTLRASSECISGGRPVVCFSSQSLGRLSELRRYRRHRRRWDFEPYGLAIERSFLERLGARPVRYVSPSEHRSAVDSPDAWLLQPAASRGSDLQWTLEREWRLPGDLRLATVPPESMAVFVPDRRAADRIAPDCPWPIIVLNRCA